MTSEQNCRLMPSAPASVAIMMLADFFEMLDQRARCRRCGEPVMRSVPAWRLNQAW